MVVTALFDSVPLWAVFLASLLAILLSIEIGYRFGLRSASLASAATKIHTGQVVAASLGLLAFILAFAFGVTTSRTDQRRNLVLEHANAIGTAFLRTDLLPASGRYDFKHLLTEYAEVGLALAQAKSVEEFPALRKKADELEGTMWSKAVEIAGKKPDPISALFVQSVNELIDLHQTRFTVAIQNRMPSAFWKALYGLTFVAMLVQGYDAGVAGGRRSVMAMSSIAVGFSVVLLLIVQMDRPLQFRVAQSPMLDLHHNLQNSLREKPADQ